MMIEEFVDLRVRAGETERLQREREQLRRADERRRLGSVRSRRAARADGGAAASQRQAGLSAATGARVTEASASPERELAHAAR